MQSVLMFGVKRQTHGSTMPKVPMGRKMQCEAYETPNGRNHNTGSWGSKARPRHPKQHIVYILFFKFWLQWVFIVVSGLSLVMAQGLSCPAVCEILVP